MFMHIYKHALCHEKPYGKFRDQTAGRKVSKLQHIPLKIIHPSLQFTRHARIQKVLSEGVKL